MKVAIVHDWLVTYAGSERVLEQLLLLYPEADLYSLIDFVPEGERSFLQGRSPRTSFLQRLPGVRRRYRQFLPLMPLAIEQFDMAGYDLVISSSHAVAKGVLTGPSQLHICFCHSPIRYAWDLQHEYLRESGLQSGIRSALARYLLHRVRTWDIRTSNGVDSFVANSAFVARRIWKIYRRKATVIYPPVDVATFSPAPDKADYYVTASRMVPYKRIDLIVETFATMPDRQLVVVGAGPNESRIRLRQAPNVRLLGYQPLPVLREHLQKARAFVFAAEEDFGIAPLEAQACGTPVIAYGRGGVRETIRGLDQSEPTGVFFDNQSVDSLRTAVEQFERTESAMTSQACRANALRFGPERFREHFLNHVEAQWRRFHAGDDTTRHD